MLSRSSSGAPREDMAVPGSTSKSADREPRTAYPSADSRPTIDGLLSSPPNKVKTIRSAVLRSRGHAQPSCGRLLNHRSCQPRVRRDSLHISKRLLGCGRAHKPVGQINDHSGEKAGFSSPQKETGGIELGRSVHKTGHNRNYSPRDHDPCNPKHR